MTVSLIPRLTHKSLGIRLDECAPDNLMGYLGSVTMTTYLPHNQCHMIDHLKLLLLTIGSVDHLKLLLLTIGSVFSMEVLSCTDHPCGPGERSNHYAAIRSPPPPLAAAEQLLLILQ